MPELGYRLEDRPGAPSAWKPDDPALLKREAAERQRTKLAAQRKKLEQSLKLKQTVRARSPGVPPLPWGGGGGEPHGAASGAWRTAANAGRRGLRAQLLQTMSVFVRPPSPSWHALASGNPPCMRDGWVPVLGLGLLV